MGTEWFHEPAVTLGFAVISAKATASGARSLFNSSFVKWSLVLQNPFRYMDLCRQRFCHSGELTPKNALPYGSVDECKQSSPACVCDFCASPLPDLSPSKYFGQTSCFQDHFLACETDVFKNQTDPFHPLCTVHSGARM